MGSAGPTTSGRKDAYAPTMMFVGARGMIGKGGRLSEVVEAMKKNSGVYFGAEAIRRLDVEEKPLVVIIDCEWKNFYKEGRKAYLDTK